MKKTLSFLGLVVVSAPASAAAQQLALNPAVTAALAYDTNVLSVSGEGRDDWLGTLIVNVPLDYRPTPRFSLSAGYLNVSERYQTYSDLDDWQARQAARLGFAWAPRRRTQLNVGGQYVETNRPGEVFEDTGLELARRPSTTYSGDAGLTQGLGARSNLRLGYTYQFRELEVLEDQLHRTRVQLSRRLGSRTDLGVSWRYERRLSEAEDVYEAHILLADWNQEVSQRLSFSVSAGTRFSEGNDPRPEGRATLRWSRQGWSVQANYAHTLAYAPRASDLGGRLGTSDSAQLTVSFRTRRLRLSAGPAYYWTRNDSYDTRVWRALAGLTYMPLDWLGFDASYSYVQQDGIVATGLEPTDRDSTRHVARIGLTIAPWNRRGAEGLP